MPVGTSPGQDTLKEWHREGLPDPYPRIMGGEGILAIDLGKRRKPSPISQEVPL